jgi:DNA-binding XRE family transcriptional regulator
MNRNYNKQKETWDNEDRRIRGDIARYLAMSGVSVEELAHAIGLSRTTMYVRMKDPGTFSLSEFRLLQSLLEAIEQRYN